MGDDYVVPQGLGPLSLAINDKPGDPRGTLGGRCSSEKRPCPRALRIELNKTPGRITSTALPSCPACTVTGQPLFYTQTISNRWHETQCLPRKLRATVEGNNIRCQYYLIHLTRILH